MPDSSQHAFAATLDVSEYQGYAFEDLAIGMTAV